MKKITNTWTKILVIVLGLTAPIPLKLGIICLFSHDDAIDFFGIQTWTPDINKLLIMLGGFVFGIVIIHILALTWLLKGRKEGMTLSLFVGLITLGRGVLLLSLLQGRNDIDQRISVAPLVIGSLIVTITIIAARSWEVLFKPDKAL